MSSQPIVDQAKSEDDCEDLNHFGNVMNIDDFIQNE